ncbi:MAG TPA: hypothetical protein VF992_06400 [Thermoplasmata archaeon]
MPEPGAAVPLILAAVVALGALALGTAAMTGTATDPTVVAVAGGLALFGAIGAAIKKQIA